MDLIPIDDILDLIRGLVDNKEIDVKYDDNVITQFIQNYVPDSLGAIISDNNIILRQDINSIPDDSNYYKLAIIIKEKGQIKDIKQIETLIIPINSFQDHDTFDKIRSIINFALVPMFELSSIKGSHDSDSFINITRKKFSELLSSLHNLQEKILVPDLLISVHPIIKTFETETNDFSESLLNDSNLLNEVTSIVNGWIKQIQSVTSLSSDLNSQVSLVDEIQFWNSLDISLDSIETQLNSIQVKNSINLLNKAKRFHVILSFNNDTNLTEKNLETKLNLSLLRDSPINDLTSINPKDPESLQNLELSISNIFNHFKRLRTITNFPLDKSLLLIELFLQDIEHKLIDILSNMELLTLKLNDFISLYETDILNIFNTIDLNVKYMINLVRELLRKRHEKFIIVRINQERINSLKDKILFLKEFRLKHENLLFVSRNFLKDVDQESKLLQEYDRLSAISPFNFSKHGQLIWANSENIYNSVYNNIQTLITSKLNNLFLNCVKVKDYVSIAEKYKYLTVENTFDISSLLKEDSRMKILEAARDEINEVIKNDTKFGDRVISDLSRFINLSDSSNGSDIKAIMTRVLSIRGKIKFYENNLTTLVGNEWYKYSIGNKVKEQILILQTKFDPELVFTDFLDSLVSFTNENKVDIRGKIIKTVIFNDRSDIVLNFDTKLLDFKDVLSFFVTMGFKVPSHLLLEFQKINKLLPMINDINENIMIIKNIFNEILNKSFGKKFELLIEGDKKILHQYLTLLRDINWEYLSQAIDLQDIEHDSNIIEIKSFNTVLEFQQVVERLSMKLNIISTLSSFLDSEVYHQLKISDFKFEVVKSILLNLKGKVSDVYQFDNVDELYEMVDKQIIEILNLRIDQELHKFIYQISNTSVSDGDTSHKNYKVNVTIVSTDQKVSMEPSTDDLKSRLIGTVNDLLTVASMQCLLSGKKFTIEDQLVSRTILKAMAEIESVTKLVNEYYIKWQIIESLINLNLDADEDINKFVNEDCLRSWLDSMNKVLLLRSMFYSSKVTIGNFVIDIENVQTRLSFRFDNFQRSIIKIFGQVFQTNIHNFDDSIIKAMKILDFNTLDSSNFISNLTKFINIRNYFDNEWKVNHQIFIESSRIFQKFSFSFPQDWTFVEQIDNNLSTIEAIIKKKQSIIEENFEFIKSRIVGQTNELSETILRFKDDWYSKRPITGDMNPLMVLNLLNNFSSTCTGYLDTREGLSLISNFFKIEIPEIEVQLLKDVESEINDFKQVWGSINALHIQIEDFKKSKWSDVKPREVRLKLENLLEECRALPIKVRQYSAFDDIQQKSKDLMKQHKFLVDLKNENLKDRHWKKLLSSIGYQGKSFQLFTLGDIWNLNLPLHEAVVKSIVSQANNEHTLEENIIKIKERWNQMTFEFFNFNSRFKLIKSWDVLFENCNQDLNELASMRNSSSYHAFENDIIQLENKLNSFYVLLDVWIEVQRQWVYLEGMFDSKNNISNILPVESSRFNNLSYEFLNLMKKVYKIDLAIDVLLISDIENILDKLSDSFLKLRRSLSEFLEKQRESFARFYFIGNDDLLELIGSGTDFTKVNSHIIKLFSGVQSIEFDKDSSSIIGIESSEGEKVRLLEPISLIKFPSLLEWLQKLELEIKLTMSKLIKENISELKKFYEEPKSELINMIINELPSQVITVCTQIVFTEVTTKSKNIDANQVQQVINLLGDLSSNSVALTRKKIENLLVELIHQMDVISALERGNNTTLDTELLYYYDFTSLDLLDALKVKQLGYEFNYGFEYLGVPNRLVYTPLISKCFSAMTQALGQKLGGSPFGPAGTGKTESVKALGDNLGRMVTVFCCDETFDFQSMSRIFLGLCKVGSWGCFDEFNRLDEKLLSAVSSQIETIEMGLKNSSNLIEISGKNINVNPDTGIFVTMNPGYVGRNDLPENLKKLFRNFSMDRPDKEIIVDVLLSSQGFKESKVLSNVIVPFFQDLEQNSSQQTHYDFGLRALKNMLNNCGKLKRSILSKDNIATEKSIILKSIDETILPKLIKEDEEVFNFLRSKYFKDVEVDKFDNVELIDCLHQITGAKGYSFHNNWKKKLLQLNQLQDNNHGIMLVGESGSGKSSCWKVLLSALEKITKIEHVSYVIDAKVLSKESLYGALDTVTREWTDGLLTNILRRIKSNLRGEMNKISWIIFDGDIDPEWAENLNSVLDDNKILTLPNGERIELPENVRILFETDNLRTTTLATISRCGMIWFEENVVDTYSIFESLLFNIANVPLLNDEIYINESEILKLQSQFVDRIRLLITNHTLELIVNETKAIEHIMDFNIHRYLNSFADFLKSYCRKALKFQTENNFKVSLNNKYIDKTILLSVIWSFPGDSPLEQRELFGNIISKYNCFNELEAPSKNLIECYVDIETGDWIDWSSKVKFTELEPHKVAEPNTVVSTTDTVRHENLIHAILSEHKTLLLCGPPGSGKTMTLLEVLKKSSNLDVLQLNFSKESSPESLMNSLKQYCEYQRTSNGIVFTPKISGKWVVVFCDEINLPGTDKFGCQTVVSLMRQMIERNGFWHTKEMQWVTMNNIQFVGACNSPKDPGRQRLTNRFLRHVTLLMVDYPGRTSLEQIYGSFNFAVMKCAPDLKGYTNSITKAMLDVYFRSKERLKPTTFAHYVYSPRELTRWSRGLLEAIKATSYKELGAFVRLWYHEGLRLFYDRLVTDDERKWTKNLFSDVIKENFPFSEIETIMQEPVIFSDWLSSDYEAVNKTELHKFMSQRLATFSEEEIDVDLVLYESLLVHALRIDRVLRQPQGHMILVGSSTSGKTTLTKFVAWMNGLKTAQLDVHTNFDINEFDRSLREILIRCVKGESICYIVDESSIIEASFIERMNTLLANSEVPGLFEGDEYKNLMNLCLEESQVQGLLLDSNEELYKWFTQQISTNLHVVFTITELKDSTKIQAISSPALFNRCVLSYMGNWSFETLFEVGSNKIEELPIDVNNFEVPATYKSIVPSASKNLINFREILVDCLIYIHMSTERLSESFPGNFLTLVNQFINVFNTRQFEMEEVQRHTTDGLNKLRETVLQVAQLKEKLSVKKKQLTKKDEEAREMLNSMLSEQNEAERKQEFSLTAQEELNKQEIEIEKRKKSVMRDLETAEPAILEARKGVQNIKKQHLTEIRSMGNPPAAVKMTMESVCILIGYDVSTWRDVQLAIRKDDFIPNIVNYSNENQLTSEIRKYMEDTYLSRSDYNFETVNRASKACGPLLQWVIAQLTYSSVLENIGPLREEVQILENGARKTKAQLSALKQMVKDLQISIEKYKNEYSSLIRDTENIKMEMESVELKVGKSLKLMDNLTIEKDRWKQTISGFSEMNKKIIGNSILSSSFLVYGGEFDQKEREILMNSWKDQLSKANITFDNTLSIVNLFPIKNSDMHEALDDLVNENGIIIKFSKIPLIIDPSLQMISQIERFIPTKKLSITSFLNESSFIKELENAIRFGGSILIRDSEYYNPILDSILRNEIHRNGGRIMIKIGDNLVDFDPQFKLFLHTADPSIKLSPFVKSRVAVTNFTITSKNLENQVLNLALKSTKPDIEIKRNNLIRLQSEYKGKLKDLELNLLDSISKISGSILDDDKVIEYLEKLKEESKIIDEQMKESDSILETIDQVRNKFYDTAIHSSSIFEILKKLSNLSIFYRFSLDDYTKVFLNTLNKFDEENFDMNKLILSLYKEVFAMISPSLMRTHKIVFAVLLTCSYYKHEIGSHFTNFFKEYVSIIINCNFDEISTVFEQQILIKDVDITNLPQKIEENKDNKVLFLLFKLILSVKSGEMNAMEFSNSISDLTSFLFSGVGNYSSMYSIDDFVFDKNTTTNNNGSKPIILASMEGFDATFKIEQLAQSNNKRLQIISLGSKEGIELVKKDIQRVSSRGDWLLIQNIQMSSEWLNHLEKLINELSIDKSSKFKIFLTTNLNCRIPTTLIENSQIFVFEHQPTLKNLLIETFEFYSESILISKAPEFRYIYFLICWYHCLIITRMKYVPISFTKSYDINESDFQSSLKSIENMLTTINGKSNISPELIPWNKISLIVGEICYGGKVDNAKDLKYFINLSKKIFNIKSFNFDFNLIENELTTISGEKLTKPDGINVEIYKQWIDNLPNEVPFSWIDLSEKTNDTIILNEQRLIGRQILDIM